MKILRSSLMALALFALGALWSCGGEDPAAVLEFNQRIAGTWTIAEVRVNGSVDNTISTAGFSIVFTEAGSFTVNIGSLSEEIKPNLGVANSGGTWTATGTSSIRFTDGTGSNVVTLSNITPTDNTQGLTNVTVSFNAEIDKSASSIAMDLVKQ